VYGCVQYIPTVADLRVSAVLVHGSTLVDDTVLVRPYSALSAVSPCTSVDSTSTVRVLVRPASVLYCDVALRLIGRTRRG